MSFKETVNKYWFVALMPIVAAVYLFFPNINHMADSLCYGAEVKYGTELFNAHHLLFNFFNRLVFLGVKWIIPSADALRVMQAVNAVFALASLTVFYKIIYLVGQNKDKAAAWTLFAACSFGVMRFAAEAETYIIPIFFSQLSSYGYFQFVKDKKIKYALFSGLMASVACLFHQIHLFWGIGLFFGFLFAKQKKAAFYYLFPTPIVLIVYSMVLVLHNHTSFSVVNLYRFLADYYYSESADASVGLTNFLITPVTFFRTFFQVHGIVANILKWFPVFYVLIPIVLGLIGYSALLFFKTLRLKKEKTANAWFENTHFLIFILQFGFAFYSSGNSEFMVMLPFLIPIFLPLFLDFDLRAVKILSMAMFIWNFFFAIYPNHLAEYRNNAAVVKFVKENPDRIFVLKEAGFIKNAYFYNYGVAEYDKVIDIENLKQIEIASSFYTDVFTRQIPFNRGSVTSKQDYGKLKYIRHVRWFDTLLGGFYIDEAMIEE